MAWVEISQAAFALGISERTIRNWIKSGKLNARTDNGIRLVEIPDEELDPDREADAEAFENHSSENSHQLSLQKRLEVSLLECGRVKGTLASQEKVMENLSANVGELSGKLQRNQAQTWKLIVAILVVTFCGVIATLATNAYFSAEQNRRSEEFNKRLDDLRTAHSRELAETQSSHSAVMLENQRQHQAEMIAALAEQRKETESLYQERMEVLRKEMSALKQEYDVKVASLQAEVKIAQARIQEMNAESGGVHGQLMDIRRERDRLQTKLENYTQDMERYQQLKSDYTSLEDEMFKYRRRVLEMTRGEEDKKEETE